MTKSRVKDPCEGIVFRNPPGTSPVPRGQMSPATIADFLSKIAHRPGEWAVYRTNLQRGTAHAYASNLRKKFRKSEWLARKDRNGKYTLFVRVPR